MSMSDDPAAALDGIRGHAEWFREAGSVAASIAAPRSARDVPRLLAALDEVLKLHHEDQGDCDHCWECEKLYGEAVGVSWPCPTVQAISRALQGEESTDG